MQGKTTYVTYVNLYKINKYPDPDDKFYAGSISEILVANLSCSLSGHFYAVFGPEIIINFLFIFFFSDPDSAVTLLFGSGSGFL
jgi:hypothetical protein